MAQIYFKCLKLCLSYDKCSINVSTLLFASYDRSPTLQADSLPSESPRKPKKIGVSSLSLGEGNGTPLQYSCLENPMDGGAWWATVHGVAKSWTRLSDVTFTFHSHALEKEMVTHSSVLALRIPGTGEPGGLPSTGSQRAGHD